MSGDGSSTRKVAVAHFMPWSEMGGVEIATLRLVEATQKQFRHIAFCLRDAVALRSAFEKLNIETAIYTPPEPSLRHIGNYYRESKIIQRQLRQVGADIVHFADEKAAYHNSLAAKLAHSRILCHIRSSNPHFSMRQKICLWPVHGFLFVSKESRRSFALALPASKTRVIYDAIEIPILGESESSAATRRDFFVPDDCALVGMVARVAPVKDYFTLADAAVDILARHPNTRFMVVGDNSLVDLNRSHYAEIANRLKELKIFDRFIFTGHRNDLPRLIAAMDLCVLSTHREGLPLSVLEAMAMGKPVVATAVGGIPEIIRPGVTGYLHEHANSKELAAAVLFLIENPEEARRIGSAAREHVRENHSRQKFVDEIAMAYSDVMRGRGARDGLS
jgi:glycosyltransferase involved in cell wall biosynthesis